MKCEFCGGVVSWVGSLIDNPSTKCAGCGRTNCQEVEPVRSCSDGCNGCEECTDYDANPDGIQPGQNAPVRMDPGTGAWDAPGYRWHRRHRWPPLTTAPTSRATRHQADT
jgi:hypothetical protein